ncbi:MAG: HNH endonuclease [Actinomycetales bacterium]|nr:HNH endonuclease [Actinomycetales bacterium]
MNAGPGPEVVPAPVGARSAARGGLGAATSVRATVFGVLGAMVLGVVLGGCALPSPRDRGSVRVRTVNEADVDGLLVANESHRRSYRRTAFGRGWFDIDDNGCDTRDDMLARDLAEVRYRSGSRCVVLSGVLIDDPYGDGRIEFRRGGRSEIDIDHVVPLAEAWRSGAWAWTKARRTEFANSPENLLAVSARLNRGKGDDDIRGWLPEDPDRACEYVARFVAVKRRWQLSVDKAELASIRRVVAGCGSEGQAVAVSQP